MIRLQVFCALMLTAVTCNPVQNMDNVQKIRLEDIENDNLKSEQEAKRNGFRTTIGVTNDINAALGKYLSEQSPKFGYPSTLVNNNPTMASRPFSTSKSDGWIPLTHLEPPKQGTQKSHQPLLQPPALPPYSAPSNAPFWNQPLTPIPVLPPQMPYPMTIPYMALPQVFFLHNKGLVAANSGQSPSNDLLTNIPQQTVATLQQGIIPFVRSIDANAANSNMLHTFISSQPNLRCSST